MIAMVKVNKYKFQSKVLLRTNSEGKLDVRIFDKEKGKLIVEKLKELKLLGEVR